MNWHILDNINAGKYISKAEQDSLTPYVRQLDRQLPAYRSSK